MKKHAHERAARDKTFVINGFSVDVTRRSDMLHEHVRHTKQYTLLYCRPKVRAFQFYARLSRAPDLFNDRQARTSTFYFVWPPVFVIN